MREDNWSRSSEAKLQERQMILGLSCCPCPQFFNVLKSGTGGGGNPNVVSRQDGVSACPAHFVRSRRADICLLGSCPAGGLDPCGGSDQSLRPRVLFEGISQRRYRGG